MATRCDNFNTPKSRNGIGSDSVEYWKCKNYSLNDYDSLNSGTSLTCSNHNTSIREGWTDIQVDYASGHRDKDSTRNYNTKYALSGNIIEYDWISALYDAINEEVTARKSNYLYDSCSKSIPVKPSSGDIACASIVNNLKIAMTNLNSGLEKDNGANQQNTGTMTTAPTVSNTQIIAEKSQKYFEDINTAYKDCICYSDCGGYSVCYCYGNCNHY